MLWVRRYHAKAMFVVHTAVTFQERVWTHSKSGSSVNVFLKLILVRAEDISLLVSLGITGLYFVVLAFDSTAIKLNGEKNYISITVSKRRNKE